MIKPTSNYLRSENKLINYLCKSPKSSVNRWTQYRCVCVYNYTSCVRSTFPRHTTRAESDKYLNTLRHICVWRHVPFSKTISAYSVCVCVMWRHDWQTIAWASMRCILPETFFYPSRLYLRYILYNISATLTISLVRGQFVFLITFDLAEWFCLPI